MAVEAPRADYHSKHLAIVLSAPRPAFTRFAVDSLGKGKLADNPVLVEENVHAMPGLQLQKPFQYTLHGKPSWRVTCDERTITLRSDFVAGSALPVVQSHEPASLYSDSIDQYEE